MRKLIIIAMMSILFISACSNTDSKDESSKGTESNEVISVNDGNMGDLRQETQSKDVLPDFLDKHDENMQVLYTAVAEHQELLEHMPCYCGCGESVGHGNNLNCFVHEVKDDGVIVWDDHATRCQVCLDIAAESIIEYNDGKTINEIREDIDNKYKDGGYPEPTDTKHYSA